VSDDAVRALLREAPLSFLGTVERLRAATMGDVPIDEHTAIVHVDQVLRAPEAFAQLAGTRITVQLNAKEDEPEMGEQFAFFASGSAFGDSLAVDEVGRLPISQVQPQLATAAATGSAPFAELQAQIEAEGLRAHVDDAAAVVVGRVTGLTKVTGPPTREHDPDWWVATIEVHHVEKGRLRAEEIEVLYANSLDVRWRNAPKPKAAQDGMWILHATSGALKRVARFQIEHPEDYQPVQHLEALRTNGG
jgi:hypothetical protein